MDKYRMDSHKLVYHPRRVSEWLAEKNIYPLYMEISPTSACNHRCVFCGLDFVGYQKRFLERFRLKQIITELGGLKIKSIMYAGEGEPFLHPDMADIIVHTKTCGIDVGITTNGVLMTPDISEQVLGVTEWIKVSCNAGSQETYSKIHRTKKTDFNRVIENLKEAVKIKRAKKATCTLGIQTLLLPENADEIRLLAVLARDAGIDYLVVKPYSQHPQSRTEKYNRIRYEQYFDLEKKLEKLNTSNFCVIFRLDTMKKWDEKKKNYKRCLALPFWSYLDACGNVWGCSVFLKDERFLYGNIYEKTFRQIWENEKRLCSLNFVANKLDPDHCRINCRMDAINRYLWELKHPPDHVNFI
jgi:MoaA/NifB/PqqE/SkfB family radical SAM enzyme